jgi:glycosyltransferase involved in cell wall biosynthesis
LKLAVQTSQRQGDPRNSKDTADQRERHRNLAIHWLDLVSGVPTRLIRETSGDFGVKLFREQGNPFVLKVELRDAETGTATEDILLDEAGKGAVSLSHGRRFSASELEAKLWGGFAEYAVPALEQLKANSFASLSERSDAAWHLTRWFYVEEEYERALDNVEFARGLNPAPQAHFDLAEAQCLVKLQRYEQADVALEKGGREHPKPDFQILRSTVVHHRKLAQGASIAQADQARLDMLNDLYVAAGLCPIRKKQKEDPLHISNITAVARPKHNNQNLKVSVIIPAHNAAETLDWVIDSLLEQTWRNVEVIVVDDCSTDDTCQVVERIAGRDSRVRLVGLEENGGAYAARNAGLRHASGELITVHDSDDWSHPQRIELQVNALESDDALVATKSYWVRVSEDLDVIGAWIPKGTVIDLNFSSLLFRRELLEVLGAWDDVLVSGDAEFFSRLKRIYGGEAVLRMPRNQLLAFALTRESSLTRSKATHLRSLYYGLRGNYRGAYLYWHSQLTAQSEDLPFDAVRAFRRFPVPPGNRPPGKQRSSKYDMIVMSDLAMGGGAFVSTLNYIIAACKAGQRVAVFHWRRFDLSTDAPLQARLYEACMDFAVDILAPGDSVEADVVLVGYPTILEHKIEPMPDVRAKHLLIVVNQFASRLVDGEDRQYDPLRVRAHLRSIFGTEGVWVPISAWVKRLMQEDDRYPTPYSRPWHPLIDVDAWCTAPIRWRGAERHTPTIGRHGRDTYTKWPSRRDALAQAYGVGQGWDVRFLGGADHAIGILGSRPDNWSIVPFDEMTAQEFLQNLDFYVHYPHEKYIEEFGRGVMEAMALGIPAVLPPQFEETFGNAATYALASEVPDAISELWRSPEGYLERAHAARSFVLEHCSLSAFSNRLAALLKETEVDSDGYGRSATDPSTATGR